MPLFLRALWNHRPLRHMAVLVVALFVIKEQFPFSNFPMYSNFEPEADVMYVTDQNDKVVAMQKLFGTKSAQTKKTYNGELGRLTHPHHRDSVDATAEERAQAGKVVLAGLVKRLRTKEVPPGTKGLRLYRRTFVLKDSVVGDVPPERLAEQAL